MTIPPDPRPIARPYAYSFRPLNECATAQQFRDSLAVIWGSELAWGRITRIDADHPIPGYSPGWYYEGWRIRPELMDPPHRRGPFSYPVQASPERSH